MKSSMEMLKDSSTESSMVILEELLYGNPQWTPLLEILKDSSLEIPYGTLYGILYGTPYGIPSANAQRLLWTPL